MGTAAGGDTSNVSSSPRRSRSGTEGALQVQTLVHSHGESYESMFDISAWELRVRVTMTVGDELRSGDPSVDRIRAELE